MRWVGIDEAGYGPNLGPLVMTAVVAETPNHGPKQGTIPQLDLWSDLKGKVDRAGGELDRLWVDDSKVILRGGKGRERLEATCVAALHASGLPLPQTLTGLLEVILVGPLTDAELSPWFDESKGVGSWPWSQDRDLMEDLLNRRALAPESESWRISAIYTVVVGPCRFNRELAVAESKAEVHFSAFARLLQRTWELGEDGSTASVTSDKHGGRHYYLDPLSRVFPDIWIDRGNEGPGSSQYTIRNTSRRMELNLIPKADRENGLVALASIISKTVRELWMDGFNRYWQDRIPGLRPTAGYPLDAQRFRKAIEEVAMTAGCDPSTWWRMR